MWVCFEISINVKIERHNPSIKGVHVSIYGDHYICKCVHVNEANKIWLERGQSEMCFSKIAGVLIMKMAKFKRQHESRESIGRSVKTFKVIVNLITLITRQ